MEKALASGADALILDLEDSVAAAAKPAARDHARAFLLSANRGGPELWVRVNPLTSDFASHDIRCVMDGAPAGLVLPKATSLDLRPLRDKLEALELQAGVRLKSTRILPIATETPAALFELGGYASCPDRLAGLTWGAEDLSAAVGALSARDEAGRYTPLYDLARSLTLVAAAAAGVDAIETVYPDFRDLTGLRSYLARARRDGFVGMMAIHPTQVAIINAAFEPTPAELADAQRIVEAFNERPDAGAIAMDGKMLDAPHLRQARRILQRARSKSSA